VEQLASKHCDTTPALCPLLAFQVFRPALPARVEVNGEGVPVWMGFARRRMRIMEASGPWRREGSWWESAEIWGREEWDVYSHGNGEAFLCRLFRDLQSSQWFIEGMYD